MSFVVCVPWFVSICYSPHEPDPSSGGFPAILMLLDDMLVHPMVAPHLQKKGLPGQEVIFFCSCIENSKVNK